MARVFVTGSSTGLGLMAGQLLAEQGHRVVLHARDEARREDKLAFQACNAGFYHQGMVHYAKALELLGIRN